MCALAEACRLGIYRAAHRVSAAQREVRRVVRIREQLVRMRTQTINQLRAQLRQDGIRLTPGSAETVVRRLDALALPAPLRAGLAPLRAVLVSLAPLIADGDGRRGGARPRRPGGAAVDDGARDRADHGGHVSRGPRHVGALWRCGGLHRLSRVGAAGGQLRRPAPERRDHQNRARAGARVAGPSGVGGVAPTPGRAALHAWVERLAARRGRRIAVVALARRLARILYAIWRDETEYQAAPVRAAA